MQKEVLALVVGGGPAPGINGVISSATIEAINEGVDVLGIVGGFKTFFEGREGNIRRLSIDDVSRLHTHGGSILGTSRDFPDNVQEKFRVLMSTIRRLGIDYLITIGGEGTLFMANWIYKEAQGSVKVAHVPKTIDNDIPLPGGLATFGYETARHLGVHIVTNLMEDARSTGRWYLVVTMGRHAGHLALGIGKAAGATVTLIPEEFAETVCSSQVADVLLGSIIKRLSMGKDHGVAVLAEGISEKIILDSPNGADGMEKDDMGRVRLSELPLGEMLKRICRSALDSFGLKVTIVDKNVGYELRAAPHPFRCGVHEEPGVWRRPFSSERRHRLGCNRRRALYPAHSLLGVRRRIGQEQDTYGRHRVANLPGGQKVHDQARAGGLSGQAASPARRDDPSEPGGLSGQVRGCKRL